jgi:hypothetical protein
VNSPDADAPTVFDTLSFGYARGWHQGDQTMFDEGWDLNERGQVKFAALMGYAMATFPEGGLVRLEYAETEEDLERRTASGLQLHLSARQAREIGEALRRLADTLEGRG